MGQGAPLRVCRRGPRDGPRAARDDLQGGDTGRDVPVLEVAKGGSYHLEFVEDPERCEYFVPMNWLQTVSLDKAVQETGLFGNQNTVCKPTTPKWSFTVERLKEVFPAFERASKDASSR